MNKEELKLQRAEEKRKLKEASDKIGKPYLIYRMVAGVIDFFVMVILSVVFELLFYVTLFKPLGYFKATENVHKLYEESNLFVLNGNDYELVEVDESSSKETILAAYEDKIVYFYTHDEDAIKDNKIVSYEEDKNKSCLFDSEYKLKEESSSEDVYNFYTSSYKEAVTYLEETEKVLIEKNTIITTFYLTIFFAFLIGSNVTYLVFPLIIKDGPTVGQFIFKICLMDSSNNQKVKKNQIIIRAIAHISVNYLMPMILLLKFDIGVYSFMPFVCNLFMMCLTKENKCLTDYISQTTIINKSRVDALDVLASVKEG